MGNRNTGYAICRHCGAEFRLFTIFNRDMQGLAWARPYAGKTREDSSLTVDLEHTGFVEAVV